MTDDDAKRQEQEDRDRLTAAIETLQEHFDTVQIFVTRVNAGSDGGGTVSNARGSGNWLARVAQAREWIEDYDLRRKKRVLEELE